MQQSVHIREYKFDWLARVWIRIFTILSLSFVVAPMFAVIPLVGRARWLHRFLLSKALRTAIDQVASHDSPDAIIIRRAVPTPNIARVPTRKDLLSSCQRGYWHRSRQRRWVVRAQKQVLAIMGAMDFVPLVQCYHPSPSYIFHAKAVEDTRTGQTGYPHKLPNLPATTMPYLPFGPSLFGEARAEFEGSFSPDAVVFIMLERQPLPFGMHRKLGPRIFAYDEIEERLSKNPRVLDGLRQESFSIRPDPLMGICPDSERSAQGLGDWGNKFGTVNGINLFGMRTNGARYMRFNLEEGRTRSSRTAAGEQEDQSYIARLSLALTDMIEKRVAPRQELDRGDILIVNNRRVALAWDEECEFESAIPTGSNADHKVEAGDRLVFQMNFYQTRQLAYASKEATAQ